MAKCRLKGSASLSAEGVIFLQPMNMARVDYGNPMQRCGFLEGKAIRIVECPFCRKTYHVPKDSRAPICCNGEIMKDTNLKGGYLK